MPVPKELIANIYNPGKFNPQELIDRFVVRLEFFQRFYKELKDSKMDKPEQQYLILARRGMGKTTLLLRIAYEMERDQDINGWMLPVVFNEEEHGVDQLELFWERVAFYLEEKHPEEFGGLQQEMADLYPELGEQPALFEEEAFNCLLSRLRKHKKKIVLLIDNFGDIYRHFDKWEIQRLRTILQTIPDLRIVGASSIVLNEMYDTRHPFYGTFLIRKLEGLSQEETEALLLSLADKLKDEGVKKIVKEQPQRVEAMRRLTGGVIRTMILLYEVFAEAREGKALKDLAIIVDRTTPLYQDKMKELSTQQQKIVDAIAQAWDGVNAKEISLATRLSTKTISSQLQGLTENGTIERRRHPKLKSHIYLIEERFFNIWYLMRYGRSDQRVLWLTRFLEEWCADEQTIEARAEKHIRALKAGTYDPESAYYFSEAMAAVRYITPDTQHELLESTKEYLNSKGSPYSKDLRESDLSVGKKAYKMVEEGKAEHALKIAQTMRRPDYNLLGVINAELENITEAEEYFLKAFEEQGIFVTLNLGKLYAQKISDSEKARYYLSLAAEAGLYKAFSGIAYIYHYEIKDYKKAVQYYKTAIKMNDDTGAMHNLARLYAEVYKDYEQAIHYFTMAIERGDIDSMYNLALLYEVNLKDYEKAIHYYEMAINNGDANAMFNIALLYENVKKDVKQATYYYKMASQKDNIRAINNLAYHLFSQSIEIEEAYKLTQKLIKDRDFGSVEAHTAASIHLWRNKIKLAFELASHFLYDQEYIESEEQYITDFLLLCLAKKQYGFVYDYFTGERGKALKAKDRLKPVWYTLMYYLQEEHPAEYLRMGAELEETVEEMVRLVGEYEEKYK